MSRAKNRAYKTLLFCMFLIYIAPMILNTYFGWHLPTAFKGGFRGVLLSFVIASVVYILSATEDG